MGGMAIKNDFEQSQELNNESIYIDIIGVKKKYQRQGIASKLIEFCINNTGFIA